MILNSVNFSIITLITLLILSSSRAQQDSLTTTTPSPQFTACINNCRTVSHYNPVCGSNGVTYDNEFRLSCAQRCGLQVQLIRGGTCTSL